MSGGPVITPGHAKLAAHRRPDLVIERETLAIMWQRATLRLALASARALQDASVPGTPGHDEAGRHIGRLHRELRLIAEALRVARQYHTQNEFIIRLFKMHRGRSCIAKRRWRDLIAEAREAHRAQDCETILAQLDDLLGVRQETGLTR
ncbi:hypothetical protein [Paraburkholderia adhaesiva]|uniref:hypothetical protein n=1 Tax=Paraburkholderia adhaesiva TaxID=2883244 RepID=UPI001F20F983|nr:hypothetical protein [Paraburkholderia adhaesiva]